MTFGKEEVCAYLDSRGVVYDRVDHEAVFTMEAMDALSLPFANVVVKNLFFARRQEAQLLSGRHARG